MDRWWPWGLALAFALGCGRAPEPVEGAIDYGSAPPRVVVVGVDGATWQVIDPLMAEGQLPHLEALLARGVRGRLRSLLPSQSPRIWTSVATGVPPETHGIVDFVYTQQGRKHLFTSDMVRVPTAWEIASAAGVSVGVTNWWFSYPAQPVRGYVVSDHTIPTRSGRVVRYYTRESPEVDPRRLVHPPGLWEALGALVESPPIVPVEGALEDARMGKLAQTMQEDALALLLARTAERVRPSRLAFLYLKGVDRISHFFWQYHEPEHPLYAAAPPSPEDVARYRDAVARIYRHTDQLLGELARDLRPQDVLLVVSDHGFAAVKRRGRVSGSHGHVPEAIDGIYLAAGGPIRAQGEGPTMSVYDVAPTALYLVGLPVPPDAEGIVAEGLLDPRHLLEHPIRRATARIGIERVRAPGAHQVPLEGDRIEQLRQLGYID